MTVMERSTAIRHEQKVPLSPEAWPHWFELDPRWTLAQRVVAGPHFARSLLLSKFLLYVVAETLEGREAEITEHQIGEQVFDRRPGYSTVEDNIVRNYARQLRRRLAEHFAAEGSSEPLRIDSPVGGYVPVFLGVSELGVSEDRPGRGVPGFPISVKVHTRPAAAAGVASTATSRWAWKHWMLGASVVAAYSAALIFLTWFATNRVRVAQQAPEPADPI